MGLNVQTHLSFTKRRSALRGKIFIPKYYDPELEMANEVASESFELHALGSLLAPGIDGSRLGAWVRREHYGSGTIPYVRTSDFSSWRIRPDFKKGVSEEVYAAYRKKQDVRAHDILMVAHGTYLVGAVAIVAVGEEKLVLQDHVFRLRIGEHAPIDHWFLLAALSTRFVRRQIRARQFSADIIDKIGDRHLEVQIAVPRDDELIEQTSAAVRRVISQQSDLRAQTSQIVQSDMRMVRERADARLGFGVTRSEIVRRILIPKYYDPLLEADMLAAERVRDAEWVSLGKLVDDGTLRADTGVEVGKLAYGTGTVPFIRTTDIADLELKPDTRHSVSEEIYDLYKSKASLQPLDVLLIRDGTYLVGASAMVGNGEDKALFCGGLYCLRSLNTAALDPFGLLAALNLPLVRRQMRARQFTRDVIDTLGKRIYEVKIPAPTTAQFRELGTALRHVMERKLELKRRIQGIIDSIEPKTPGISMGRPGWSMR